jgi:hypothetical protein
MSAKNFVKALLTNATMTVVLATAMPTLVVAASDDAATFGLQNRNRSKFQYHDGSAEEKRPYRRPDLDVDPTSLKYEELIARCNALEERVEALEQQLRPSKRSR